MKKKTNKYAGLMKIWAAMQSTICGRPSMVSSEDIDSGDFDLGKRINPCNAEFTFCPRHNLL